MFNSFNYFKHFLKHFSLISTINVTTFIANKKVILVKQLIILCSLK